MFGVVAVVVVGMKGYLLQLVQGRLRESLALLV
jgi:hypothetical protein